MTPPPQLLIVIDGPAGAGKTTVSRMLADELGYRYLDTGALYRGVACAVRDAGIAVDDDAALERLCRHLDVGLEGDRLMLNGRDITARIRTPDITMLASAVSARPAVRRALFDIQRRIGQHGGLVAEGRDMGTVVFPEADLKFFLDASTRQRALRRFRQYGDTGIQRLEEIEADIRRRDQNDSTRDLAPLKAAHDAEVIDSSRLTARQVVDHMLARFRSLIEPS